MMTDSINIEDGENFTGLEIAVIGMNGRFPGAKSIELLWKNLIEGKETVSFFTKEELQESGIDEAVLSNPAFVGAYGWLDDIEYFDASFFDYTPLEAEIMDPQVRLFHETVAGALEDAGYDSLRYNKPIGLYAGAWGNDFWQALAGFSSKSQVFGWFLSKQLMDKDFMCTRIAHRLNLSGPAVLVDSACSTSLVAIHLASQGLLSGDCDMAVAGGVCISNLKKEGYRYEEGMLFSPDGHCRAFDARAKGTVFGNASAAVVLKRLEDALEDGDSIYAVIRGSSINNDGNRRAGYTAPSVEGQEQVIRAALQMAEVDPETIGFVETHGTGTSLGDPVEIEGLKAAFNTEKKGYCRLGALKSNIGHVANAAGVAAFIKTVLVLKHRIIPPNILTEIPNPVIDFENSPFIIDNKLHHWERGNHPLRAGVSAFGIGGTNAHVILEESPPVKSTPAVRDHHMLLLSAMSPDVLDTLTQNLGTFFSKNPNINLADAAFTLQKGRRVHNYRRMLVCSDIEDACRQLSSDPGSAETKLKDFSPKEEDGPVVFLFPGQGSQYVNMGQELYQKEPAFSEWMDRCFEIAAPLTPYDLKSILYPNSDTTPDGSPGIDHPEIAPLVIFIFEYSLAQLLIKWGIHPRMMIGYSFGEYTAACVSGVISLEDTLKLIALRGKLVENTPPGAMLSIPLPKTESLELISGNDQLFLAVDNGPSCVISGTSAAVETLRLQAKEKKIMCTPVPVSRALHSPLMAPVLEQFRNAVAGMSLNPPRIPYISNVTGVRITDSQAADPIYWGRHLSETVRFDDGIHKLVEDSSSIFLEVGPGRDISALVRRRLEETRKETSPDADLTHRVINMVRHPHQKIKDTYFLLDKIGRLWMYGRSIDWDAFYENQSRRRISLPQYPFERKRYWIDEQASAEGVFAPNPSASKQNFADWFYLPSWTRSPLIINDVEADNNDTRPHTYLLFHPGNSRIADLLRERLQQNKINVVVVKPGPEFRETGPGSFEINPRNKMDYSRLFTQCSSDSGSLHIAHLWGLACVSGCNSDGVDEPGVPGTGSDMFDCCQDYGLYSLLSISQSIVNENVGGPLCITVVTAGLQEVNGEEPLFPDVATVLGPVKAIPQENVGVRCRSVDIVVPPSGSEKESLIADQLIREIIASPGIVGETVTAYRGSFRWVETFQPLKLEEEKNALPLKENGIYLITGGFGKIGLILAEFLANRVNARLVLTGRTPLPPREEWEKYQSSVNSDDPVSKRIDAVVRLEEAGAEVLTFGVDAGHKEGMQDVFREVEQKWGAVNGVIYAAGIMGGDSFRPCRELNKETCDIQFRPKIDGLKVMAELTENTPLDFCYVMSSISAVLGGLGICAYSAANNFIDAFIRKLNRTRVRPWISVDWDGNEPMETVNGFRRILAQDGVDRIVFSRNGHLHDRIRRWVDLETPADKKSTSEGGASSSKKGQRPPLATPFVQPKEGTEQAVAEIWKNIFGFNQVGAQDDFIELGGDSLKAITMVNFLHKDLDVPVPLTEFFKEPTIQWVAGYIDGAEQSALSRMTKAEARAFYPVSFIQDRIYVLNEMEKGGTAYNNIFALMAAGGIDPERLRDVFARLSQRHESLRTSFHFVDDRPVQVVHDSVNIDIRIFSEDDVKEQDEKQRIEHFIRQFIQPFDLAVAPLFRLALVDLEGDRQLMLFDMHHMIADGSTFAILISDFIALYDNKELPPQEWQYKDYCQWLSEAEGQKAIARQERFWLGMYEDNVPLLNLRTDYPRPDYQSFEGEQIVIHDDQELHQALLRLIKDSEATRYMVLSAVCAVLLSKYTGQDDIIIGSPVAGRDRVELQSIVGVFINTLPIRHFPSPEKKFSEFLKEVKESTLAAFENQGYPFALLIEKLGVNKDFSRNPMFDFELIVQNVEEKALETRDLRFAPYPFDPHSAQVDITLEVRESHDGSIFKFVYCTRLFKRETIQKFTDHFKEVLMTVSADKDIIVRDVQLTHDLGTAGATLLEEDDDGDFGF